MPNDTYGSDRIMQIVCPDCGCACEIQLTLPKNGDIEHYTACGQCKDRATIRATFRSMFQMTLAEPAPRTIIRRPRS